jgi:hypothetical protein
MKTMMMFLSVLVFSVNVFAGDSSWRYGDTKSVLDRPTDYYGIGTPCVMSASYYGITATAQQGIMVHVILITRQGVNEVGKNTQTGALVQGLQLAQTMCGDTILLLPEKDQKVVRPILLAKK